MWFNGTEAHNKESMSVQHTEMNTKRLQWTWYSSLCVAHSWTPCYAPLPHKIALSVIKPCYCFVTELNEILLNCSKSQTQRRGNRNNALCDFLCIWYMEVQGNLNIRYHMNSLETRVTLCIINCPEYIRQFEMIKSSKLQNVLLSPYGRVLHLDISMVCMITVVSHGFKINYHLFWIIWYTRFQLMCGKSLWQKPNKATCRRCDWFQWGLTPTFLARYLISYISLNDSDIV